MAANGKPMRAATRAITSLPRSVPAANTAVAPTLSAAWTTVDARASGAKGCTASNEIDRGSPKLRARVSVWRDASLPSIRTRTVI